MGGSDSKTTRKSTPIFGDDEDDSYNPLRNQQVKKMCKCSLQTRLILFAVFSVLGWLLVVMATIDFLIHKDTAHFAILYSIGQVLNLTATCFLAGPKKQYKTMTDKKRLALSVCYIGFIVLSIVLAIVVPQIPALVLICLVAQAVSYFFYNLSFIPGGQTALKKACGCCIKSLTES